MIDNESIMLGIVQFRTSKIVTMIDCKLIQLGSAVENIESSLQND